MNITKKPQGRKGGLKNGEPTNILSTTVFESAAFSN